MAERELLTPGEVAKRLGVETCAVRELDNWRLTPVATVRGTRYLREEAERLLTRSGVARRLGKSIAAVRAIEGTLLNPSEGPGGVRLFDADEVERLVGKSLGRDAQRWLRERSIARTTPVRLSSVRRLAPRSAESAEVAQLRREVAALRDENTELRVALSELVVVLNESSA